MLVIRVDNLVSWGPINIRIFNENRGWTWGEIMDIQMRKRNECHHICLEPQSTESFASLDS